MRNVRNFWLEADIDGRGTTLAGGPIGKEDGFALAISQRKDGDSVRALTLRGWVHEGRVILDIEPADVDWISLAGGGVRIETAR